MGFELGWLFWLGALTNLNWAVEFLGKLGHTYFIQQVQQCQSHDNFFFSLYCYDHYFSLFNFFYFYLFIYFDYCFLSWHIYSPVALKLINKYKFVAPLAELENKMVCAAKKWA